MNWLFELAIVSTILVLVLVILWSGISYPGFLRALNLGSRGILVFWGLIAGYLGVVIMGFAYCYLAIGDPMSRAGALLLVPMMLGIPFRMSVSKVTKYWIHRKFVQTRIRPATNADIPAVTELIYTVLKEYGLQPDPEHTDADLQDLEGNYLNNKGSFEVLMDQQGEIIGSVGILRLNETDCELRKMYLAASERGRGFGKLLLELGLQRAAELGYKRVILETASVLKEAITLYQQYGFERYEGENPSSRCDQMYQLEIGE